MTGHEPFKGGVTKGAKLGDGIKVGAKLSERDIHRELGKRRAKAPPITLARPAFQAKGEEP